MVKGAPNNSLPRQPPGADSASPQSSFSADSKLTDRLDNESSTSGPATQISGERELRERQKKENETMELEKLEVCCGLYPFQRVVILTPLQRERKREELEHEKQEKEAKERKEEFEVRRDPDLFRQSTVLTTSQKRQMELEREKQEKEARERKQELEVCCNLHLFQWDVTPTPPQRQKRQGELEREKKEKEARERKEELEVYCDPTSSDRTSF